MPFLVSSSTYLTLPPSNLSFLQFLLPSQQSKLPSSFSAHCSYSSKIKRMSSKVSSLKQSSVREISDLSDSPQFFPRTIQLVHSRCIIKNSLFIREALGHLGINSESQVRSYTQEADWPELDSQFYNYQWNDSGQFILCLTNPSIE